VQRAQVEESAVPVSIGLLIQGPIYLHESVFGPAIVFGVVADTVNIIGVVIQRPVRVMFEVVVISGLGQLFRRW
jgi:hypothetical protein